MNFREEAEKAFIEANDLQIAHIQDALEAAYERGAREMREEIAKVVEASVVDVFSGRKPGWVNQLGAAIRRVGEE